jgi:hypothetical protein
LAGLEIASWLRLFAQLAAPDKPEDGIDIAGAIGEASHQCVFQRKPART